MDTGDAGAGEFVIMPLFLIFMMMMSFGPGILTMLAVMGLLAFGAYFFVRPMLMGSRPQWGEQQNDGYAEKRKHDFDEYPFDHAEKAKREPRYVMGDDGEMLEVIEEDKPKRSDDIHYV